MRILGLDLGEKHIGVALSDALGLTAQRLTRLDARGTAKDLDAVRVLAAQHGVEVIVVGLPLTLQGEQGPRAKRAIAFCEALRRHLTIPVHLIDERLTTVQGERALLETDTSRRKRKQVIDLVAAQLILQHYLETIRPTES